MALGWLHLWTNAVLMLKVLSAVTPMCSSERLLETPAVLAAEPVMSAMLLQKGSAQLKVAQMSAETETGSSMARDPLNRTVTFVTLRDSFFETNLGRSSLWKNRGSLPHQWIVLEPGDSITPLYVRAQAAAVHKLRVFLHADVFLPEDWYQDFMIKLTKIEDIDPHWGVVGAAGVPLDWYHGSKKYEEKMATSVTVMSKTWTSGIDSMPVQALDEFLLVLNRDTSPSFDPLLPGVDLFGTDIVLSVRAAGKKAYLLNTKVLHKTIGSDGLPFDPKSFRDKVRSPSYRARAWTTKMYLQQKWCGSGLLPVYGTIYDVLPCEGETPHAVVRAQ